MPIGGAVGSLVFAAQCDAGGDKCGPRFREREAEGVLNAARSDFVIAHEAGKDRQASRIRRRPGVRTLLIAEQIPHRGRIGVPASVGIDGRIVELVKKAIAVVEDEHVAIAGAGRSAFHGSVAGTGIGPGSLSSG